MRTIKSVQRSPLTPWDGVDAEWVQGLIVRGYVTRERCCDGKARFAKWEHAEKARQDISQRPGFKDRLLTYPCPFCGGFHFTGAKDLDK